MAYKQNNLAHKSWATTGNSGFSAVGIIAKLRNMIKIEVPVAYQDETGFHYGTKSAHKDAQWPYVW